MAPREAAWRLEKLRVVQAHLLQLVDAGPFGSMLLRHAHERRPSEGWRRRSALLEAQHVLGHEHSRATPRVSQRDGSHAIGKRHAAGLLLLGREGLDGVADPNDAESDPENQTDDNWQAAPIEDAMPLARAPVVIGPRHQTLRRDF
eukprot:scaffold5522_cov334-Pinguiococcus_pyrenoidosus.AAC.4